ncbi:hypothetical protein V502_01788 [Pseudogymnoascus sp. VKM F-4520 (FW-2644)]|nr:hypothetical protein V502_01788 [Pseudogymnoascus sp. VKM F-4520 (FW-2644)]
MFAITMVAVILHLEPIKISESGAILLIVTTSIYALLIGMRMRGFIFQRAFAIVHQGDGMLKIELQPSKPTRIYPGQHVWLRISSKGYNYLPFTESHPFTIASWEKAEDGKAKSITFLIDPRKGFTRKLKQLVDDNTTNFSSYNKLVAMSKTDPRNRELQKKAKAESKRFKLAFFDGPYGQPIRAEEFGTVILYATGIGVGAQLAVVKHLLESRESGNAKTQRITLLWEVEHEFFVEEKTGAKRIIKDTAYTMVLNLLQQDCDRLSRLRVSPEKEFEYKSGWQGASPDQGYPRPVPTRLHNVPDTYHVPGDDSPGKTKSFETKRIALDPDSSLSDQLNDDNCRGSTWVSVCAYPGFARALRNVVARKGLHFHEHEFRPKKTSVLSVNV